MGGMSVTRWRLAAFLRERGLSAYALAKISAVKHPNTVYRIARDGHEPTRVDLPTLTAILDGLRQLTGEDVRLTDILVYDPAAPASSGSPVTIQNTEVSEASARRAE